jgi:hypothetical protein
MNEKLPKLVLRVRTVVYIVGSLTLLLSALIACQKKDPTANDGRVSSQITGTQNSFWPSDLVSNPEPSDEDAEDESEGLSLMHCRIGRYWGEK